MLDIESHEIKLKGYTSKVKMNELTLDPDVKVSFPSVNLRSHHRTQADGRYVTLISTDDCIVKIPIRMHDVGGPIPITILRYSISKFKYFVC